MNAVSLAVAVLFSAVGLACVVSIVLGLPGVWILLVIAGGIELLDQAWLPDGRSQTFQWWLLGSCALLGVAGEVLELLAGMLGVRYGGGSRRGMWGALIGGIAGAIVFTVLLPMPVVGSLVGALLGTFAGAVVGELQTEGRQLAETMRPALGATIGRVLATVGKVGVGVAVWTALTVAAFWP